MNLHLHKVCEHGSPSSCVGQWQRERFAFLARITCGDSCGRSYLTWRLGIGRIVLLASRRASRRLVADVPGENRKAILAAGGLRSRQRFALFLGFEVSLEEPFDCFAMMSGNEDVVVA